MPGEPAHAVIVLLQAQAEAQAVARILDDRRAAEARITVVCPPVRGRAFFADDAAQSFLDVWWRDSLPAEAVPVYLLEHEPGLPPWLRGIDGVCFVGALDAAQLEAAYADLQHVHPIDAPHPLAYAVAAMELLGPDAYDVSDRERLREFALRHPGPLYAEPLRVAETPRPFELLAGVAANPVHDGASSPGAEQAAAATRTQSTTASRRMPGWVRSVGPHRAHSAAVDDAELAHAFARRRSTIVAVGSRKGGVGKTSHAAGIAIAAGECMDLVGHRAAIVDANIANPDAWGQLNLGTSAVTVRRAVAALIAGDEVPEPVYATTPALACYPETRDATEYSHLEIARFAEYLRARYSVIVVDLTNRIPDPTAGPEASAAAFWLQQSDVVVLPTASAKQDFNGVLDYLEVPGLPPTVVAHIRARSRRNREHPLTRQYLEAIACRCARVVDLPDDAEGVRYAVLEGVPVQTVSSALRAAYRRLTQAIADVAITVQA